MECEYCQAVLPLLGHHSKFEKTPVKVLLGMVLANSHIFTEFEDSEDSPKWAFLHSCCCDIASGTSRDAYVYIHTYRYTSIAS